MTKKIIEPGKNMKNPTFLDISDLAKKLQMKILPTFKNVAPAAITTEVADATIQINPNIYAVLIVNKNKQM